MLLSCPLAHVCTNFGNERDCGLTANAVNGRQINAQHAVELFANVKPGAVASCFECLQFRQNFALTFIDKGAQLFFQLVIDF